MLTFFARAAVTAALLACASATSAETLTFRFTGTVDYTRDEALVPLGSRITGTFSYDEDAVAGIILPGYAAYQLPSFMSATVNGHDITSDGLDVAVLDNAGGNVEDMVTVNGSRIMIDNELHMNGFISLALASGPGSTRVLSSTDLPTSYDLSRFDSDWTGQNATYAVIATSSEQDGALVGFEIDAITGGHQPDCTNPQGKSRKCKKP